MFIPAAANIFELIYCNCARSQTVKIHFKCNSKLHQHADGAQHKMNDGYFFQTGDAPPLYNSVIWGLCVFAEI